MRLPAQPWSQISRDSAQPMKRQRPGYRAGRAMLVLSGLVSATDRERADMSLFQRAHDIVAAKADKALDAAEKPDEMLDYSYNQMLEQITRIRRALVDIAASRKQIELQETQLQHSIDHLNDQAKTALGAGPGGPGPRGAVEEGRGPGPDRQPGTAAPAARRGRGEAGARAGRAAEAGEQLPLAEGSPQGAVHRRQRDELGQRGRGGHFDQHQRLRRRPRTRPGQDLHHAGPGRRAGRAAPVRRPRGRRRRRR